ELGASSPASTNVEAPGALIGTNFNLSFANATVNGIQVLFTTSITASLLGGYTLSSVQLVYQGAPIGTPKRGDVGLPIGINAQIKNYSFGSATDNWGADLTQA